MFQLDDIHIFLEVLGRANITAAAKALGFPKSTVARQLARLEAAVGGQLITRATRKLKLTERGEAFLPYARRLIEDVTDAKKAMTGSHGASGTVTVSASSAIGRLFVAPIIPEFRRQHPGVRVRLRMTALREPIESGGVDVAFRLGAIVDPSVSVRCIGTIDFGLYAAPEYLNAYPPLTTPSDLCSHSFVELRPPVRDGILELQDRSGAQSMVSLVSVAELDDPSAVREVVIAAGGIAALPSSLVRDDVAHGRVRQVLSGWAPPAVPLNLVYSARYAPAARVRVFIDFILATIGRTQPWSS